MKSTADLLRLAAESLEEGTDPFNANWLRLHEVSLDQCLTLGEQLAIGARIVAAGIENPRSLEGMTYLHTIAIGGK